VSGLVDERFLDPSWMSYAEPLGVWDAVHKSFEKLRVILKEPTVVAMMQQGLKKILYKHLESPKALLMWKKVNFTRQEINRELALKGSIDGELATLDLKEASNRVALWIVEELFTNQKKLLEMLLSARSGGGVLPGGEEFYAPFRMFAGMGSATCFPIQAVVFYSIAVGSLVNSGWPIHLASRSVYVYGDDVIVPRIGAKAVRDGYKEFGFVINEDKSFWDGLFRESCGMDAFAGVEITPVKIKAVPSPILSPSQQLHYYSVQNRFMRFAWFNLASVVADFLLPRAVTVPIRSLWDDLADNRGTGYPVLLSSKLPTGTYLHEVLARNLRWNKRRQLYQTKVRVAVSEDYLATPSNLWSAIAASLASVGDESGKDSFHFDWRYTTRFKRAWRPVYGKIWRRQNTPS
jgi:hypothetical protein